MKRQKLTLSVDRDLIRRIKLQAIEEWKSVSDITEECYSRYLQEHAEGRQAQRRPNK